MRDINLPLRKAYTTALTGLSVEAYYQQAPDNISVSAYIIFDNVSGTDSSSLTDSEMTASMRVTVHTFSEKYNSGVQADQVMDEVIRAVYGSVGFNLPIDAGFDILVTKIGNTQTIPYNLNNTRNYIDRITVFNHKIQILNL